MNDATDPALIAKQPPSGNTYPQLEPSEHLTQETQPQADLEAEFERAQAAAIFKGKIFASSEGDYLNRREELLPELSRVRKNIHQRQTCYKKGRRQGAPNWGRWLKFWRAQTGIKLSDKWLKKLLDEFDQIKPAPKKLRAKTMPAPMQKKIGLALLAVFEMLANVDDQGKVTLSPEDIAIIHRMAPKADDLYRLIPGLPDEAGQEPAQPFPEADPGPAETDGTSMVSPSSTLSALGTSHECDLPAKVIQKCAPDFKAIPTGLPPTSTPASFTKSQSRSVGPTSEATQSNVSHIPPKRVALTEPYGW